MLKTNRIPTFRTDAFKLGDWLVEPATGTLRRKNGMVHLPPKLTELLMLLVENEGEVISKEKIIDSIWPDTYVTETALTRCISELRAALGDNSSRSLYIETIPKRGYRLCASVMREQPKRKKSWELLATAALIILAVGATAFHFTAGWWKHSALAGRQSLVVMPFAKTGTEQASEMLAIGITGNIIECLSRISDLKVISATSLTQFKNNPRDTEKIVESTGVRMILDGEFQFDPQDQSLRVHLIDVTERESVWDAVYPINSDKTCSEVASEISLQVASALNLKPSPSEVSEMTKDSTSEGAEAHRYCIVADHFREPENAPLFRKAECYYKQALVINPSYAPAYAGLAQTYMGLDDWGETDTWAQKAQDAVIRALALDSKIPESHLVNGMFLRLYRKDYLAAESAFREAIRIDPNHYNARREYGLLLMRSLGRLDEALFQFHESYNLDPLGLGSPTHLVELYCIKGDYDKAMEFAKKAYESYPMHPITSRNVALVLLLMGKRDLAIKWAENAVELMFLFPRGTGFARSFQLLTILYLEEGRFDKALEVSRRLDSVDPGSANTLAAMGLVALYQGESGNAESCFREALNKDPNGAIWPTGIRHSTFLSYLLECRGSRTEAERVLELSSQLNRENNLVTFEKNVCPAQVIQDVLAIPLIRGERTEARRQLDLALTHGWRAVSLIERNPIFMDFMEEDEFRQVRRNIDKDIEALCRRVTLEWPEWINENAFNPGRGLLQPGD